MTDGQTHCEATERTALYKEAADRFGPALERFARGYEADADLRRDLIQDIHVALWRSLPGFDGRCSLRTWVYRVAHNAAAGHVLAARRRSGGGKLLTIEEAGDIPAPADPEREVGEQRVLDRLQALVRSLKPLDRQVILLWLEDLDASSIAEVTGLTPGAVATRIHRIKATLAERFQSPAKGNAA